MALFASRAEKILFVLIFLTLFGGFLARYYVIGYGIGSGGNYYYGQLVSFVLDGDVDLRNQFNELPFLEKQGSPLFYQKITHPDTTKPINPEYSIGPGILWLPFFVTGHLLVLIANATGATLPTNGFSWVEQMVTMAGSILYATIGLFLCYRFARRWYSKESCLLALAGIVFGFATLQYVMVEPSVAHAATIFTFALFFTYFYDHRDDNSWKKWMVLGVLAGLLMLSKWQEAFWFSVPLVYFLRDFWTAKLPEKARLFAKGLVFVAIILLLFFPQMAVWKQFNDSYLKLPAVAERIMDFTHPVQRVPYLLFSFHHSLIVSTPIILLALLGAIWHWKKDRGFTTIIFIGFALLIYINSSLVEMGGNSFGARRFVDATFFFVLFLAALLDRIRATHSNALWYSTLIIMAVCVGLNLIYFMEYNLNMISRAEPVTYWMILQNASKIVQRLLQFI